MTSRHALETLAGSTHASSVNALESCNEEEFGTLTRAFVPLKERAPPTLPFAAQVAFEMVPVLPLPEVSVTVVPDPWSNEYAATRPPPELDVVVADAAAENVPTLPAASVARISYV